MLNITGYDKEYITYFLNGYTNCYRLNLLKCRDGKWQYKRYKIGLVLMYLGLPLKYKYNLAMLSFMFLPLEFIFSLFYLFYKFSISILGVSKYKKEYIKGEVLYLDLGIPCFRMNNILKSYPYKEQIKVVCIPYIKSGMSCVNFSIYSGLKINDCMRALKLSVILLIHMYKKYYRYDFLFRAYSSFEYFLSCIYIEHSDETNRFLYVSTYDRWAYLMGNDAHHSNIFIQHGILEGEGWLRYKAPHTAYYINRQQQKYFEDNIFIGMPIETYHRPCLEFTSNERLIRNGKINVLIVCCNSFFDYEKKIIQQIMINSNFNVYVKPHPGFKDHSEYYKLQKQFNIEILNKEDYPCVDVILSYDSTLACEYEEVGVPVLRYSDAGFDREFKKLISY